ncbi:MAG: tetratricopeptide repeat protein [Intestinibacter bartlettii]
MTNNELNTRGIVESIDKFNENSEQICITLNGLEGSINEFNKSITKLDSLKQIDITKKKMDELNTYKNKVVQMVSGLKNIDKDLSELDELIKTIAKFGDEIHSVMKNSNMISFTTVSKNVRDLDKKITAFNKRIDTFIESELLKKMDTQYEGIMEHIDSVLERQQKMIDEIDNKLDQIAPETINNKLTSSNIVIDSKFEGNIENMMRSVIEDVICKNDGKKNSKSSIYAGFSTKVLQVLSEEGELEASYILGNRYYDEGEIDKAVLEYEKLVDNNDNRCEERLIKIYKQKSKEENPLYQEKLGFELYRGKIIKKDIDKAIKLLEKAEKNGSKNSKKYLELINLK